jgi:site-specific DNA-methyltransferase (adenine-specific)
MNKIELYNGDCLEVMKGIPDGSVDLVVSDIPYGISFSEWDVLHNNTNSALLGSSPAQEKSSLFKSRGKPINGWSESDKNRGIEFQQWCLQWLQECFRVLKPASPMLIMTGRQYQHHFTIAAENAGFLFKDCIIWDKKVAPFRAQCVDKVLNKRGIAHSSNWRLGNLAPIQEPIVYCFKPYKQGSTLTDSFIENGLGCFNADIMTTNLISVNRRIKDKQHETQKPVDLFEKLIELVSKSNHIVLDPFMGSGTTGVACKNTNRNFIGIELDEKYFEIARERIEKA